MGETPSRPRLEPTPSDRREAHTPRVFVTFTEGLTDARVDARGVSSRASAAFGPYLDVEISDREMYVRTADGLNFCLATMRLPGGWQVHDGLERERPGYKWVRFHTCIAPAAAPQESE